MAVPKRRNSGGFFNDIPSRNFNQKPVDASVRELYSLYDVMLQTTRFEFS
jgi:hypothetical protein